MIWFTFLSVCSDVLAFCAHPRTRCDVEFCLKGHHYPWFWPSIRPCIPMNDLTFCVAAWARQGWGLLAAFTYYNLWKHSSWTPDNVLRHGYTWQFNQVVLCLVIRFAEWWASGYDYVIERSFRVTNRDSVAIHTLLRLYANFRKFSYLRSLRINCPLKVWDLCTQEGTEGPFQLVLLPKSKTQHS